MNDECISVVLFCCAVYAVLLFALEVVCFCLCICVHLLLASYIFHVCCFCLSLYCFTVVAELCMLLVAYYYFALDFFCVSPTGGRTNIT